jgi:hypothetical protein
MAEPIFQAYEKQNGPPKAAHQMTGVFEDY